MGNKIIPILMLIIGGALVLSEEKKSSLGELKASNPVKKKEKKFKLTMVKGVAK